jgi:hypothetical protein
MLGTAVLRIPVKSGCGDSNPVPLVGSQELYLVSYNRAIVRRPYRARTGDLLGENEVSVPTAPTVHQPWGRAWRRGPAPTDVPSARIKRAASQASTGRSAF